MPELIKKKKKIGTCNYCGCEFSYTQDEVTVSQHRDIDGTTDTDYTIVCPGCNKVTRVASPYSR